VPKEEPHESVPRGRAILNQRTGEFALDLDKCLEKKAGIVRAFKTQLTLVATCVKTSQPVNKTATSVLIQVLQNVQPCVMGTIVTHNFWANRERMR
jgi:hypothetical protein